MVQSWGGARSEGRGDEEEVVSYVDIDNVSPNACTFSP